MPPKPPHKKPSGSEPPHKKPHPLHKPLSHKKKGNAGKLWASAIVGFGLTLFVAVVMAMFAIPVTTILPHMRPNPSWGSNASLYGPKGLS